MSTLNTSATGGYLQPSSTVALPKNLTFTQFIQTVLVGVSALPGDLVRPDWQQNPPKRPDVSINWLAFGISESVPYNFPFDGNVLVGESVQYQSQVHERFEIKCSVYGPAALENYRLLRDGFYIAQNREALTAANMGLIEVGRGIRLPELIDERWFDRWEFFVSMRFQSQRTYPVLTFQSATGTLFAPTAVEDGFQVDWLVST